MSEFNPDEAKRLAVQFSDEGWDASDAVSAATQLRAACEEVERLTNAYAGSHANRREENSTAAQSFRGQLAMVNELRTDRDRLAAEVEQLKACCPTCEMDHRRVLIDNLTAENTRLAAECERQRRVIEEMRPVYEAAVEWRKTMDWSASRAHKEQFTCEVALVDAVDTALAAPKEKP